LIGAVAAIADPTLTFFSELKKRPSKIFIFEGRIS
jgi:hypothetical protein